MADFSEKRRIVATCAKAMPPILAAELREAGFPVLAELDAAVETEGSLADTIALNLRLRTAHRVLYLVSEFEADSPDELYAAVRRLPWHEFIDPHGYFSVSSAVFHESILDTRFAGLKCKDAVADEIRAACGSRPSSGPETNRTVLFLYWQGRQAKVYIDTSGEPLSKRGYRRIPLRAPMQETLAAGVLLAAGWTGAGNLVNPMCGSGTLAIEGALLALGRAPGLLRDNFGFMHVRGFERSALQRARAPLEAAARSARFGGRIVATDRDPKAVDAARRNARAAGVDRFIDFRACDFRQTPVPPGGGLVILNPEYGERMGEEARLEGVYRAIGDFLKQKCGGYRGAVFTGNLRLAKCVGLRSQRRVTFYNSRIECRLLEYDIYAGTRQG